MILLPLIKGGAGVGGRKQQMTLSETKNEALITIKSKIGLCEVLLFPTEELRSPGELSPLPHDSLHPPLPQSTKCVLPVTGYEVASRK